MRRPFVVIRCLLAAFMVVLAAGCAFAEGGRRIAHAGGGFQGQDYTNSLQALDENIKKGFILFEMDLSWTRDFALVCVHDWERAEKLVPGLTDVPTLDEFKRLVRQGGQYHICTVDELVEWLESNPKARLVTDVKMGNIQALRILSEKLKGYQTRVIPQIYQPEEFALVKELGYRDVIWTLYRYRGSGADMLSWVDRMDGLWAVTMPVTWARAGAGRELKKKGIYTYTHTINDPGELEYYRGLGIDNVYTDFLPPD